jgi:hypothetical protein
MCSADVLLLLFFLGISIVQLFSVFRLAVPFQFDFSTQFHEPPVQSRFHPAKLSDVNTYISSFFVFVCCKFAVLVLASC